MPTWGAKNVLDLRHANDTGVIILIVRVRNHAKSFLELITVPILNYNSRLWSNLNGAVSSLRVFQETDAFELHLRNEYLDHQRAVFIRSHLSFLCHIKSISLNWFCIRFYRLLHMLISRRKIMIGEVHHHLFVDGLNHCKMVLASLINGVRISRVDPDNVRIL